MTYNEFMTRPQSLRRRIQHKADDVAFKLATCEKATSVLGERVQTSPSNTTERNYVAYIDAKRQLEKLVDEYDSAKEEVTGFLYDNLSALEADLLEWRYVNDKDLQEIADLKGMAYQTIKNQMSAAEKDARAKFYKLVPKSTEKDAK